MYEAGQTVRLVRGWDDGAWSLGSLLTLTRRAREKGWWYADPSDGTYNGLLQESDFEPATPVVTRTVTRQEIVPGTYDGVVVESAHVSKVFVRLANQDAGFTEGELDRAAAVLTALAGALRDGN